MRYFLIIIALGFSCAAYAAQQDNVQTSQADKPNFSLPADEITPPCNPEEETKMPDFN